MLPSPTLRSIGPETRATRPRRISVLGATGSIGESTLDLIGRNPSDYQVVALTGGRNVARLAELAILHRTELAVIADPRCYAPLRAALAGTGIKIAAGEAALIEAAGLPADWVMAAIVGAAGLKPTLEAVRQGTATALANKVFPVPGAPNKSTPLGAAPPRRVYFLGSRRKSTTSISSFSASYMPATSSKVTLVSFS